MKRVRTVLVMAGLLTLGVAAGAQTGIVRNGGCVNSPENPTALLALVGTAGGFFSYARARRRARKGK